jgi:methionyl-tRNA synthetase
MSKAERFTITAALPYANGPVHIGHLAGCYLPADIFSRYQRLRGRDVLFVCGSDEHGVPITIKAKNEGITPQQVVDKYHVIMKNAFEALGISFDIYSRTSAPIHHETASEFFRNLYLKGELIEKETMEFYDEEAGEFLADRYIVGTCPNCNFDGAYGDQCENCGKSLSPDELLNPRSKLSGAIPVKKSTRHYYLDLGKHQDEWLKDWIESKKDHWKANVYGQCMSWMGEGENKLKPRAVTRDLKWGVPVPSDIPDHEGKVLYVWFDAPIGYISATKDYFSQTKEKRESVRGSSWMDYWGENQSQLIHFIGKDNIVFHCIIFPVMLHAHGGLTLPKNVPANEFLNLEGNKISTSRNWAVWLHEYLTEMPGREDELRYVLTANMPENKDNDFIWKYDGTDRTTDSYQAKVNNELVNNLGNFVNRVVVLTHKFFEGKVPESPSGSVDAMMVSERLKGFKASIEQNIENYQFRAALQDLMKISAFGNQYMQSHEPWKLIKTNPEKTAEVMNLCLQIAAEIAVFAEPFMPKAAMVMKKMLGMNTEAQIWNNCGNGNLLPTGTQVAEPVHLFRRVDEAEIDSQLAKLAVSKSQNDKEKNPAEQAILPSASEIQYDDFIKNDIRVGTILEAERIPKADKLLKLTIDTGLDQRTILSGIAEHFAPEEIIGKQVCVLINLAPRKMRGFESQGMILMAEDAAGKLHFVNPEGVINNGSKVS